MTLVAYFSYSGNTKTTAEHMADLIGADLFEIKTQKAYSEDYQACVNEAREEVAQNARPVLIGRVEDIEKYDTIILEEVIEHLKEPLEDLMRLSLILNDAGKLIIRTRLFNEETDLPNWWYLRDQTHICFFSYQTFKKICELLNLRIIYCNDVDLIILQKV